MGNGSFLSTGPYGGRLIAKSTQIQSRSRRLRIILDQKRDKIVQVGPVLPDKRPTMERDLIRQRVAGRKQQIRFRGVIFRPKSKEKFHFLQNSKFFCFDLDPIENFG